jgi:hypothetical protein
VHESFGVSRHVDVEDPDGFVFQGEVVVRLGRDFDFGSGGLKSKKDEASE